MIENQTKAKNFLSWGDGDERKKKNEKSSVMKIEIHYPNSSFTHSLTYFVCVLRLRFQMCSLIKFGLEFLSSHLKCNYLSLSVILFPFFVALQSHQHPLVNGKWNNQFMLQWRKRECEWWKLRMRWENPRKVFITRFRMFISKLLPKAPFFVVEEME